MRWQSGRWSRPPCAPRRSSSTGAGRNPASAHFGSAGAGSAAHFIGSALAKTGGADLRHVAFRGSQPAIQDMLGGQIAAVVGPTGEFMPNVSAGRLRLLATSGPKRGRFTPLVSTLADQGYKDLSYDGWFGFFLPARAPQEVVQRLNTGIRTALGSKDVVDSLAAAYMEPMISTPGRARRPAQDRNRVLGRHGQAGGLHAGGLTGTRVVALQARRRMRGATMGFDDCRCGLRPALHHGTT
jgi:hypothetical protein